MKRIKNFKLFEALDMDALDKELSSRFSIENPEFSSEEQEILKKLGADEVESNLAVFNEKFKSDLATNTYQIVCKKQNSVYTVEAGQKRGRDGEVFRRLPRPSKEYEFFITSKSFKEMLESIKRVKEDVDLLYGD